jgi:DNA-binding LytR/AlgR family response regulator
MNLAPVAQSTRATAVIADDEEHLRNLLQRRLAVLWPELSIVGMAANGDEAAGLIERLAPQVAFLDIRMPGRTGLQVARDIDPATRIVFVTAYDEFALDAFERAAVDYLVKPVDETRLARTVERLKRLIADAVPPPALHQLLQVLARSAQAAGSAAGAPLRWIRASRGDTTFHIPVAEVLYFRSDDKYTVVNTAAGEHLIRTALGELAQSLDAQQFWQIHRSTIVNMEQVVSTRRDDSGRLFVQLRDGSAELPVSRAYAARFRQM